MNEVHTKKNVSILCAASRSNYYKIKDLDIWDANRNAYNFDNPHNVVVAHPPCAQWSRMRAFSKEDNLEKELAIFCFEKVQQNGGILEHPAGSTLFKYLSIPFSKIISVDQHFWNFPARKRTYLYFNNCKPLQFPLNFDAYKSKVCSLHSGSRSIMPLEFCQYLVDSAQNQI